MKTAKGIRDEFAQEHSYETWDELSRDIHGPYFDKLCDSMMQLYSDQQNKEKDAEIQRLTTNNKELEEKLMSEQTENGYLQAFRVSNEAEIQRLTKEVEQLRLKVEKWVFSGVALHAKNTRLRELLGETLKWLQWNSHSDAQLLASKIDNALNHKP